MSPRSSVAPPEDEAIEDAADDASAMGQTVTGPVEIQAKQVNVHVDLPMLLAMPAGKIKPQIEARGRKLLEKPQS